jgi:hypothetical protein
VVRLRIILRLNKRNVLVLQLPLQALDLVAELVVEVDGHFVALLQSPLQGLPRFLQAADLLHDHAQHGLVVVQVQLMGFCCRCVLF